MARWSWGAFRVTPETCRCAWFWGNWGISGGKGCWVVYHLPSRRRVTSFVGRGIEPHHVAKKFGEKVDQLADWSSLPADIDQLSLRMHRVALQVTGGRPDLRIVSGESIP